MRYLPVLLDLGGFACVVAGVWILGGVGLALLAAGVGLMLAGYRAQS